MRQKIDYGIDLGTTNSAIARMEAGKAIIIKSDDNQMDTTPSCVFFNKKKTVFIGQNALHSMESEALSAFRSRRPTPSNGYIEFKRTMGTDHKYESTNMERNFSSEALSAEMLKKLRGYIRDEEVSSVVITVPAMFKQNQIDATHRAAELAGFKYCELLQEPIAASIAYGIEANTGSGHWLVFDLGGGTFDAALMHVEGGIMKVVDTEGDNHLGGKNIDTAIIDQLFVPEMSKQCEIEGILGNEINKKLLQDALKRYAEQAKIALSSKNSWDHFLEDFGPDDDGEEIQVEFTISLEQYEKVCGPLFQKSIDICQHLLERNNLSGSDLSSIVLVGGPTFSQTLRRMLKDQISNCIDTSVDPMTSVAKGSALFASTKNIPSDLQKLDASKAQLTLKYPETTVEIHENIGIRIDRNKSTANLPPSFSIEVIRADRGWSTGKVEMDGDAGIIEVVLNDGKANQFDIKLFGQDGSIIPCEPSSITIIHGLKIANPTLPLSIGLEVYSTLDGNQGVYAFKGLEKNKTLPAKGKGTYKTAKDIRPGNRLDKFTIQFYDFEYGGDGSRAIFNNPIGGTTVTGEKFPSMLPAQSEVDLTLSIDASRRLSLSIYISSFDETIEVQFESNTQKFEDVSVLKGDIEQAREIAEKLDASDKNPDVSALKLELNEVERLLNNRGNDFDTKVQARDKLKKTFIALDKIESTSKWPKLDRKLDAVMKHLLDKNSCYGNEKYQKFFTEYQERVRHAKSEKDCSANKQIIKELYSFWNDWLEESISFSMSYITDYDESFETVAWTDKREARRILNDAKNMIATNPSKSDTYQAVHALWLLIPNGNSEVAQQASDYILRQ